MDYNLYFLASQDTYSTFQFGKKNKLAFYVMGVIVEIAWTFYNFYLNSIMAMILEPILLFVVLMQLTNFIFKDKLIAIKAQKNNKKLF